MQPGIYDGVPNEVYHASPGISKTGLVEFDRSPARYRFGERKDTRPLQLGTLFHTALLEPHELDLRYHPVSIKLDARTNAYKAAEEAAAGREIIRQADYDNARRMRDTVMQEPVARELITPEAVIERSAAWIDPATDVLCRCRPDLTHPRLRAVVDLKKCQDCRPRAARSAVSEYKYHWAEAFYSDGIIETHGWAPDGFIFFFIEEAPPFLSRPYEIDPSDIHAARTDIQRLLPRYRKCLEQDVWPRFPGAIERLEPLPPWAHSDLINQAT